MNKTQYILVQWPESQLLMEHPRFSECLFVMDIDGHEEVGSSAYMCPSDLFREIFLVRQNSQLELQLLGEYSLSVNENDINK